MKPNPFWMAAVAIGLTACVDHKTPPGPPPDLTLTIAPVTVTEGTSAETPITVKAVLSRAAVDAVEVPLSAIGGSATANADFSLPATAAFAFAAGATEATFTFSLMFDRLSEGTETIQLATGAIAASTQNIAASTGLVTILDDEAVVVTIEPGSAAEVAGGTATLNLVATLSAPAAQSVSIPVAIVGGGTATVDKDYRIPRRFLDFNPGSTSTTLTVIVLDDAELEPTEVILLQATAMEAGGQRFEAADRTEISILDNETRGPNGLTLKSVSINESAKQALIEATLTDTPLAPLTLDVAVVSGGTAVAGRDFVLPSPSTLTIPAGQKKANFTVTVVDDNLYEGTEAVQLQFSAPSGELGTADLEIVDNDPMPKASFLYPSQTASEATTAVAAVIALDSLSESEVKVTMTAKGTVAIGSDVTLPAGGLTVTIPPATQSVQYPIKVLKDSVKEGGESLKLTIISAQPAAVSPTANTFDLVLIGDYGINDTGVTTYTNGSRSDLAANPTPAAKQDADFGRDSELTPNGFRLTKLDIDGNPLPSNASSWNCVRDEVTGFIWEVKAPARADTNPVTGFTFRSASHRYTWYSTAAATNGGYAGALNRDDLLEDEDNPQSPACAYAPESPKRNPASYCNTQDFVKEANRYAFCGRSNWMLPAASQLLTLADYGFGRAALPPALFNTIANNESFFSADTAAGFPAAALCLNTFNRRIEQCQKNVHYSVMLISETPK